MKIISRLLGLILFCSFILSSLPVMAQQKMTKEEKKEARQQRKAIKRAFKKLNKRIAKDPELREEFYSILKECPEIDTACQDRLQRAVNDSVSGSELEDAANGLTFGICHPTDESQKFHKFFYSKKNYLCKLSSNGEVYDKAVDRKLFGPGLLWDKQSIVLMCTGPAYGTKAYGSSVVVGAGYGITLASVFGKVGLCLAVGAGQSVGFFIGAEKYKFEKLDLDEDEDE